MAGWKEYFSFSKRERTGAITLVILILVIFLLPEFLPASKRSIDMANVDAMKKEVTALKMFDADSVVGIPGTGLGEDYPANHQPYEKNNEGLIFIFDPNTLSEQGWKKLGIRGRTIQTIQKYISKGGRFMKPEDLGKMYGLPKDQYERLLPFVRIKEQAQEKGNDKAYTKPQTDSKTSNRVLAIIDINEADTSMLIELPGIGSKLSNRIINFRDKLGGFYSVAQVKEIYGLPDSTYQKIKLLLQCDPSRIQKININTAEAATLKNHPYINWNIANAIVNYRQQHGDFKSTEDLLKIVILSPEILEKINPYVKVN